MRTPGIEPGAQAWEACMLPLHYERSRVLKIVPPTVPFTMTQKWMTSAGLSACSSKRSSDKMTLWPSG
jgi:hypothetical protein